MNPAPTLPVPRAGGLALVALMLVAHAVIAVHAFEIMSTPLGAIIGLIIISVVAVGAVLAPAPPLPLPHTLAATAAPLVVALINNATVIGHGADALWHLSASAFLLLVITVRGRPGMAWAGMIGASAATLIWGAFSDFGFDAALGQVLRQVPILAMGTAFLAAMSALQRQLTAIQDETARLSALEAASVAAAEERSERLEWARRVSQPILERIAEGRSLSPELRMRAGLVEAELRDGLRAPTLAAEPVTSAVRRARERGVEVVLLDDRGSELCDAHAADLRARIAEELDATTSGRFVARVLPDGRTPLATVLVDGPEGRRLELDPAGPTWGPTRSVAP